MTTTKRRIIITTKGSLVKGGINTIKNSNDKLIAFRGKISQKEIAKKYGVSQQAWSKYEKGKSLPSLILMLRLEKDIGIPMERIFFKTINNKKKLKQKPPEDGS